MKTIPFSVVLLICCLSPCSELRAVPYFGASDVDTSEIGTRIPLILIHGINSDPSIWSSFLSYYSSSTALNTKFKPYVFHYFTRNADMKTTDPNTIDGIATSLGNDIQQWEQGPTAGPVFGFRGPVVILAHSMGGLVARAMIQDFGSDKVLLLITLATPHHGTPVANEYYTAPSALKWIGSLMFDLNTSIAHDLSWDCFNNLGYFGFCNDAIAFPSVPNSKIIAYGAKAGIIPVWDGELLLPFDQLFVAGYDNDGAVPIESALFNGSGVRTRQVDQPCDHFEIYDGTKTVNSGIPIFEQISDDLLGAVTSTPTLPIVNSFSVSPTSIQINDSVRILYSVSDNSGTGLKQISLWRSTGEGSANDPAWTQIGIATPLSGNGPQTGQFTDIPSSVGSYWYGIHVINNSSSQFATERSFGLGPKKVIVGSIPVAATPTIMPNGGTFNGSVQIQLGCTTSGALLYYTIDGSEPNGTSLFYQKPFTLSASATVNAKASANGFTDSATASASFTKVSVTSNPTVATPMITPNGGSYSGIVPVSISCPTTGAGIYFTTDGTDPVIDANHLYAQTTNLTLSGPPIILKARAFANGYDPSAIQSATFTLVSNTQGNDKFANAIALYGSNGKINGSTLGATWDSGATGDPKEPLDNNTILWHSVWFAWTAPFSGAAKFWPAWDYVVSPNRMILFGVFTGSTLPTLYQVVGSSPPPADPSATFHAVIGTTYQIEVGEEFNAYSGDFTLNWQQTPDLLAPSITTAPQDQQVKLGGTANFSVAASGSEPLQYKWFLNDNQIANGTSSSLTFANVTRSDAGNYVVSVSNSAGSITSAPAKLLVMIIPPTINLTPSTTGITITFTGTLQRANAIGGPYTDVNGTSPQTFSFSDASSQFFRTRQ